MARRTWRSEASPIIRRVLETTRGKPEKEIKAALDAAYPFGSRSHWPFKIWCSEIRRQRGTMTAKQKREQAEDEAGMGLFAEKTA